MLAQDFIQPQVKITDEKTVLFEVKNITEDTILLYANDWIVQTTYVSDAIVRKAVSNVVVFSEDSFSIFFNRHTYNCKIVYWDTLSVIKTESFIKILPNESKKIILPVILPSKNYNFVFCHLLYSNDVEVLRQFSSYKEPDFDNFTSMQCNEEAIEGGICIYFFNPQKAALMKKYQFASLFFDKMKWYHKLLKIE